ncbi:MAG: ATP-binding protein, partial [Pseudomonadota bacterium]
YSAPEKRRKEEINLNELLQSLCDSITINIDFITKGLALKYSGSDENIKIYGDQQRIEQALNNILINSIYASPQKGKITCSLSLKHGEAAIKITNNGEKIPKDNLDKIFQPFFTTKEKGTGLGLAIAKNIISAHNGRIDVMSSDKETVFRIGVRV